MFWSQLLEVPTGNYHYKWGTGVLVRTVVLFERLNHRREVFRIYVYYDFIHTRYVYTWALFSRGEGTQKVTATLRTCSCATRTRTQPIIGMQSSLLGRRYVTILDWKAKVFILVHQ